MVFVFFSPSRGLISNVNCSPEQLLCDTSQYPELLDLKTRTRTKIKQKKFLMFADNHGSMG